MKMNATIIRHGSADEGAKAGVEVGEEQYPRANVGENGDVLRIMKE